MKPHDYEYLKAMVDHPAGRGAPGRRSHHHPFQPPVPPEHLNLGEKTPKDETRELSYYQRKTDNVGAVLFVLLCIFAVGLLIAGIGKLVWAVIPWL